MRTHEVPGERWHTVAPWLAFLRESVELELSEDADENLALRATLRRRVGADAASFAQQIVALREVLELLEVIAICDIAAWGQLLRFEHLCDKASFWQDWTTPPKL